MKAVKIFIIWIVTTIALLHNSHAQILSFDGLGRAVVTNDKLNGNIVEGDTVTPNKATSGYTLLDLGVNIRTSDNFKVRVEFRARNNFGQFFGAGSSINIRQFQVEGIVKNKLYYSIGDVNVIMTPYTVFNTEDINSIYESELFSIRRRIVEYENFIDGNNWRVQGAKVAASVKLDTISKIAIYGFASRTRTSNNAGIPDRYLTGASVHLSRADFFKAGVNYTGFFDNAPATDQIEYVNHVVTANYLLGVSTEKIYAGVEGESGLSSYDFDHRKKDTSISYNDYFYDVRAAGSLKKIGLKVSAGYLNVGPQYSSPSAQTQRIYPFTASEIFPTIVNGTTTRAQNLFDRFTQERIYNQSISPVLFQVLPEYSNVLPYGIATPNRKGIVLTVLKSAPKDIVELNAEMYLLKDIIGEGTQALRSYRLMSGGFKFNGNKILNWKKTISLSTGAKQEHTQRDGFAEVDFTSMLVNAGLVVEVLTDLDLLAGIKFLNAKGNEFIMVRDEFNYASSFIDYNADIRQQIIGAGVRYRFTKNSFATIQGYHVKVENNLWTSDSYSINQLFINYTVKF